MNNGWQTKADVLRDLGAVNGRRTGAEELHRHVVAGERPPPVHHEIPDEDEMSYFSGGHRVCAGGEGAGPDLAGISTMLKIMNDMDETVNGDETMTLYRNRATDQIRISKLNPHAGEYVPGGNNHTRTPQYSPNKNKRRINQNAGSSQTNTVNVIKQNGLPTLNVNMFKSKCQKDLKADVTDSGKSMKATESETKRKEVNPTKYEIKEIQDKIKSSIIASSTDNSLKMKRQKNVAIATLLKLGTIPSEPVKLIKPEYFEKPPTNEKVQALPDENVPKEKVENLPSTSSSETNENYLDQDSISKVDSWFTSIETPKPKQVQEKLVMKDCITYKKKTAASITSRNTSTPEEKESPKETKSFKPSSYANDLLKKYETNAQRQAPLIEDLGTRLERQLKERDEVARQKMLARQNAG